MKLLKPSLVLLTASICTAVTALPGPAFAQNGDAPIVMPKSPYNYLSGWSLSVGGRYQQFSNNGSTFAETDTCQGCQSFNISPSYQWGYDLGVGYKVPVLDTDLKFNYTHLDTSNSNSVSAPSMILFPDALAVGPVDWAKSTLNFNYDSFDFTAGHMVQITTNFALNLYGGLNYTHLAKRMETWGSGLGNDIWIVGGTSFNGVGPTFGLDGYCSPVPAYPNFSIFGGMQPSFIYGTMTGYSNTIFNGTHESENIPNEKLVVPALGGKLGLDYWVPYYGMTADFKLGYEFKEYFNVSKESNYTSPLNVSFQGPYFLFGLRF